MKESYNCNPVVYNDHNEYGANQRHPYLTATTDPQEYAELCHIVALHFPEKSQAQIDELLQNLRQEGCGYVAMINSLFQVFIDRPDKFCEKFGFEMYDHDGTLNYNHVLVDLYCQTDNHNGLDLLFYTWDLYNEKEDKIWADSDKDGKYSWENKPAGNNEMQMKYRWESYCKKYGIKTSVKINRMITPANFEEYALQGSVSILCSNFTMHNSMNIDTHVKGGHYMTITGVADEHTYIVSSWGKKYYLDPQKIKGFKYYQIIKYDLN